jgi:hypothetical protein
MWRFNDKTTRYRLIPILETSRIIDDYYVDICMSIVSDLDLIVSLLTLCKGCNSGLLVSLYNIHRLILFAVLVLL